MLGCHFVLSVYFFVSFLPFNCLTWAFYCVDNKGCGKLVDDLSSTKFDHLVQVLSCPASERYFKSLLTPENIQEVPNHLEEFIPHNFPRINFSGSAKAQAREWV